MCNTAKHVQNVCRPVVHRDLKSANILLAKKGADGTVLRTGNVLKIADFGLARDFSQTTKMTQEGTVSWMAPEVLRTGRSQLPNVVTLS
jgi:serine/threonine protein kinase